MNIGLPDSDSPTSRVFDKEVRLTVRGIVLFNPAPNAEDVDVRLVLTCFLFEMVGMFVADPELIGRARFLLTSKFGVDVDDLLVKDRLNVPRTLSSGLDATEVDVIVQVAGMRIHPLFSFVCVQA